jgi:hypothetical protein
MGVSLRISTIICEAQLCPSIDSRIVQRPSVVGVSAAGDWPLDGWKRILLLAAVAVAPIIFVLFILAFPHFPQECFPPMPSSVFFIFFVVPLLEQAQNNTDNPCQAFSYQASPHCHTLEPTIIITP